MGRLGLLSTGPILDTTPWYLGGLVIAFSHGFGYTCVAKRGKESRPWQTRKNLCAQIDIALHNRVTEEKDRLEMTTSQYIAALLTEYYKMKDENGGINMTGSRTMAFQIPEELFPAHQDPPGQRNGSDRRKAHPAGLRPGPDRAALAEAEASLAPQEAPESTEEASEDNGAAGTTPDASEASTEAERDTADIEQ
mgnify:CR=1 FL=1